MCHFFSGEKRFDSCRTFCQVRAASPWGPDQTVDFRIEFDRCSICILSVYLVATGNPFNLQVKTERTHPPVQISVSVMF